jgi:uncharacterized protein YjbI with pentapeptide repeats
MQEIHEYPELNGRKELEIGNSQTVEETSVKPNRIEDRQDRTQRPSKIDKLGFRDKTLWDYAKVFLIPVSIGLLGAYQGWLQWRISADNEQSKILSEYLSAMANYLEQSSTLQAQSAVDSTNQVKAEYAKQVARARTLNTLRQLDPNRKALLIKFLYESKLALKKCPTNSDGTTNFAGCEPSLLQLSDASLNKMAFDIPIDLKGIDLTRARLAESTLTNVDLEGARLTDAVLDKANLVGTFLKKAEMEKVKLRDAKLVEATLNDANLQNSLLKGADFSKSSLENAALNNAILDNANLSGASLRGAKLKGASLTNANLQNAKYNGSTQFPDGFNLEGRGMYFVP